MWESGLSSTIWQAIRVLLKFGHRSSPNSLSIVGLYVKFEGVGLGAGLGASGDHPLAERDQTTSFH